MTLLTPEFFYVVAGLYVAAMAAHIACDPAHSRRAGSALFWLLLAAVFLGGKHVPPLITGYAVLAMVALAATGQVVWSRRAPASNADRAAEAKRLGNKLLLPAALIPLLVIVGGFTLDRVSLPGVRLAEAKQLTTVALGLACVAGLVAALRITRATPSVALSEGSRLLQAIGWAVVLPQLLASLGGIFALAGVGDEVARLVAHVLPAGNKLLAVVAYCGGMALFTMIMGNAFAAFPVITLGIGLPFIVREHGGNPAIMGALGMLSGYCGTLVTPMAANFNLVPAMLLELEDKNAIIKAQAPMAAAIWLFNVGLMYACVYRF